MTGYGRAQGLFQGQTIHVELKSLNSKGFDLRLRTPQLYQAKELEFRRLLSKALIRGKVECNIYLENPLESDYQIDPSLFEHYHKQLKNLAEQGGLEPGDLLYTLTRLPGVVVQKEGQLQEEHWQALCAIMEQAVEALNGFRLAEGKETEADIRERVELISQYLLAIEPLEEERMGRVKERIRQNLDKAELKLRIDENRFEQELIYYLEKYDISEEKLRLKQHCRYFVEVLDKEVASKGSKLNFIMQEMGREINTIGSKANSADIQRFVVQMKDEAEKIKEQVSNIL